jgi:hypothetical protein
MNAKSKRSQKSQSARFLEAAKKAEVDKTGKMFERAFKKIVPKRRQKTDQ